MIRYEDGAPPREATLVLYDAVGWAGYTQDPERLLRAIAASTFVSCAWEADRLVGLARAISDDATLWFLQDLLVTPDRQGAGIGKGLLERCEARFRDVSRGVLLTESDVIGFYEGQGWERASRRGVVTCWRNRPFTGPMPPG